MPILNNKSKVDPSRKNKCLNGHTGKFGIFTEGMVVDGSNPDIAAHPEFWIDAARDDVAFHAARQEYLTRVLDRLAS